MDLVIQVHRFDIVLVNLDPKVGSEIRKTRPSVIVSPDEMNRHLRTIIVAPMTATSRPYPSRVAITFEGREGQVALDQIRTVDRTRLVRRLGHADADAAERISQVLVEMFSHPG